MTEAQTIFDIVKSNQLLNVKGTRVIVKSGV